MDFPEFPEGFNPADMLSAIAVNSQKKAMAEDQTLKLEINNFIDGLDKEQSKSLLTLLNVAELGPDTLCHIKGMVSGCLFWKHNLSADGDELPWSRGEGGDAIYPLDQIDKTPGEMQFEKDQQEAALMEQFGLRNTVEGGVECARCGMPHASLADRMLRRADQAGCPGCVNKMKFG